MTWFIHRPTTQTLTNNSLNIIYSLTCDLSHTSPCHMTRTATITTNILSLSVSVENQLRFGTDVAPSHEHFPSLPAKYTYQYIRWHIHNQFPRETGFLTVYLSIGAFLTYAASTYVFGTFFKVVQNGLTARLLPIPIHKTYSPTSRLFTLNTKYSNTLDSPRGKSPLRPKIKIWGIAMDSK